MMFGLANISKPVAYTSNCFTLFTTDVLLFIHLSVTWPLTAGLPSIVLPVCPTPSGDLDELSLTWQNAWADLIHCILFVAQILFLFGLVAFVVLGIPAPLFFAYIAAYVLANKYFCQWLLDGRPGQKFYAGKEFAKNPNSSGEDWVSKHPEHEGEKWVFINGVAVGQVTSPDRSSSRKLTMHSQHWMRSNLERLAKTFRRPILGIHNPSYGIPFDVLECILQRTFAYATEDIRNEYTTISALLADDSVKKLVLISHSQGAIEAGMVLDWLFATLPTALIEKLEVFTFGNAANHWNCPMDGDGMVIKHIEHYANEGDWVARFGILHFRPQKDSHGNASELASTEAGSPITPVSRQNTLPQTPLRGNVNSESANGSVRKQSTFELESRLVTLDRRSTRFVGRLFKRTGASGHQLNQHYLDNILPMNASLTKVIDENDNEWEGVFMNQGVDEDALWEDDAVVPRARTQEGGRRMRSENKKPVQKIWELSRLWAYRNGKTPKDWIYHGRRA